MARKIVHTGTVSSRIQDRSPVQPRVDPAAVATALGAEQVGTRRERAASTVSLSHVRADLVRRLHSSGGRPALEGCTRRVKIPIAEQEWQKLEALAAALAENGFTPSAGQVANVLLTLSLRALAEREHQSVQTELREQVAKQTETVP